MDNLVEEPKQESNEIRNESILQSGAPVGEQIKNKEPTAKETAMKILKEAVERKWILGAAVITLLVFLVTKNSLFIFISAALFIILLIADTVLGIEKEGAKSELKEIAVSIIVALAIWYGAIFLLNTPSPLDAVVSCSMLPNLERGDMVVLQGSVPNAPVIEISEEEFAQIDLDWKSLSYLCGYERNESACNYLLHTQNPSESNGPIKFNYGVCEMSDGEKVLCAKSIEIAGQLIEENLTNDVVVYEPLKTDYFARTGAIIHRVFASVEVNNKRYYIIKGDNNPVFDMQVRNQIVDENRLHGKVLLRLPYIGYYKLFLAGAVSTPSGCASHIVR